MLRNRNIDRFQVGLFIVFISQKKMLSHEIFAAHRHLKNII